MAIRGYTGFWSLPSHSGLAVHLLRAEGHLECHLECH